MRLSFDRLALMAEDQVHKDPFSGHLFLFRNKSGDKIKILYWDRDGYAIWYKRLEEGTFQFPSITDDDAEIKSWQLAALLGGIDFASARRRKRLDRSLGPDL
jgi:transposase